MAKSFAKVRIKISEDKSFCDDRRIISVVGESICN